MRKLLVLVALMFGTFGVTQEVIGNFTYQEQIDPISDADTSYIVTDAEDYLTSGAQLFVRCDTEDIDVVYSSNQFLNDNESVFGVYRFDNSEPSDSSFWSVSSSGTAAFAPGDEERTFLEEAQRANQVVIRVSDYRGQPYTSTFNLKGFTDALGRLRCSSVLAEATPTASAIRRLNLAKLSEDEVYETVTQVLEPNSFTASSTATRNIIEAEGLTIRYHNAAGETEVTVGGEDQQLVQEVADALEAENLRQTEAR